ncbi:MAG TPA: DNA polymerase III subunit gamma and tau [Streptosporangiaceae bacterium]|nr:DNA polymerase III subunit gamma and tau [Streptosporangiaceae bacterium]
MAGDADSTVQADSAAQSAARTAPLALYRRYRPATFAELKGQEHVTEPLRQALRSGRVHHAYLFSGPRGCGKTSSARILARSLNCENGPTPDPCGQCASCVALAPSGPGSIDVIEIDAASHGGIDDARDLRERAFYSPVSARYKIYIIDEAHMVTGAGFNALLKLVEEPPPHLKFVFATTEPEKVIPTIRSRTHHYPFRLVPPTVLRELLEEILAAEKISFEPAVLPVVVRAGAGSARDSLSILDQLIAGADEDGLRYDRAIALLGYTDDALLDEIIDAFAEGNGALVFRAIDHVVEAGHDPRRFAMDLLDRLRDLIILAAVPDAGSSGLLDVPEDSLERMRQQATSFGQDRLVRAAETINSGLVEMRGATSPRLLLELMCAQVLLPASGQSPGGQSAGGQSATSQPAAVGRGGSDLDARIERLERQFAAALDRLATGQPRPAGIRSPDEPRPSAEPGQSERPGQPGSSSQSGRERSQEPQRGQPSAAQPGGGRSGAGQPGMGQSGGNQSGQGQSGAGQSGAGPARPVGGLSMPDAALVRERWEDILNAVRDVRRVAWMLLSNASVDSVEGNVLNLAFSREGDAKGFTNSGCDQDLAEVLERVLGARFVVRPVAPGAARRTSASAPPAASPATQAGRAASATQEAQLTQATRTTAPDPPISDNPRSDNPDSDYPNSDYPISDNPVSDSPKSDEASASDAARGSAAAHGADAAGGSAAVRGPGAAHETDAVQGSAAAGGSAAVRGSEAARGSAPVRGTGAARGSAAARGADTGSGGSSRPTEVRPTEVRPSEARSAKSGSATSGSASGDDDPRFDTDGSAPGSADNVTGTDLILRELGGRVIEEINEQ